MKFNLLRFRGDSIALMFLAFILLSFHLKAQRSTSLVKGVVQNNSNEPIPGVSVVIKNTNTNFTSGTSTDSSGVFTFPRISSGGPYSFTFSAVGYEPQTLAGYNIKNSATLSLAIKMTSTAASLDQVVVVGYGTQKKVNLTGSVSSISGKALTDHPVSNTALALQGMAPGLSVVNRGGAAGADDVTIRIRGTGTLNTSDPLVLIDGVPGSLSSVAPSEIESISVLKDAASASIYGSRAGNGVVLVTTKRGVKEGVSVSYDNSFGLQSKTFWPKSASAGDYLRLANEAYENAGLPIPYSDEWIRNAEAGTEPLKYPFFNFIPEVFNDHAFQQSHSLSVSSGGKSGKIMVAMNYLNQDGIVRNHNYERYNIRINSDLYITKKLSLSSDLMYRRRNYKGVGRTPQQILQSILNSKQSVVGEYPNGSYDLVGGLRNARAIINKSGSDNRNSDDLVGTLGLKYDVVNGLSLKGYLSVNNTATESRLFRNKLEMKDYYTGQPVPVGALWAQNYLQDSRDRTFQPNYKVYADYNKTFNSHNIKVLLGYDEIHNSYRSLGASRDNFYSNEIREMDAGDSKNWTNWGNSSEWRLRSFFGRLNYSYEGKYLLEANLRYDGSSRFSMGKKYGAFPSFSAGWRVDQEEFLKHNRVISNLKLRGSWGKLGNQEIPLYRNVAVYNLIQGYNFNNNIVVGAAQTIAANPNITWEATTMTDLGLDLDLLKGKISIVGDYYWRVTNNILFALPIAPSIGIAAPTQNAASVSNKGWELSINYNGNRRNKDFKYTIGFNISDVINKITDLKGTGPYYRDKFNIWQEGYSINTLYGYRSLGLYRTKADLDKYPKLDQQATLGDIIYEDVNKDGQINSADRVIIGNMDPRFPIGFNFGATYKNFDFTMFWQGVLKAQTNLDGAIIEGPDWENFTTEDMAKNRYHETRNPNGTMPRVSYGNAWNGVVSDFWLQDTKYVRLKNFQLGYTFSKTVSGKLRINRLRIYISGENLLTFTPTKWVDPEIPAGRLQYYPQSKVMTAGLSLNF
ncbi:SusC/RagA family TonB-linked outer membrane protein [Segetibacter koreensis]|uniref:SusC/RagA family TonB-linked outer membrane protein n=1 Tax=Segetibacter koreensis TaxID=398037 RepID=UPI00037A8649|nr:TonB-dependent receptor [Segetibacter koreensis]